MTLTAERLDELECLVRDHDDPALAQKTVLSLIEAARASLWRDISEAPKDGTVILAGRQGEDVAFRVQWRAGEWRVPYEDGSLVLHLTHFLPFPTPPSEGES